jgi:transposase
MPRPHPQYAVELRDRLVELVRSGRSPESLAEEFEPSAATIRNWTKQADRDVGRRKDGPTTDEKEELKQLRRENRRLREEIEILGKATAWFAEKSEGTSKRRSNS